MTSSPSALGSPTPGLPQGPGGRERGLVAVVWCRQVDNEAESPGYTTLPSEFPHRKEVLDPIRRVGNFAINLTDTHDYWDPDPTGKLAFYPGMFLYPAVRGRYLCLGRMFLSTEDRPRLGMKTVVLEARTLAGHEPLGAQLKRWYLSMGNPRRPDPSMRGAAPEWLEPLATAFTYRGLAPDRPLVALVSEAFPEAVAALWELLEHLPSSLVLLAGVMVFPYFLPAQRVRFEEFTEAFPLTLALLRIPRNETGGDRHQRRVELWTEGPVHLLDLTATDRPLAKEHPSLPLPEAWWVDPQRSQERSSALAQAIDRLELPRVLEPPSTPESEGGRWRRHEMARIASAMEAVSLAMDGATGRRGRADPETLARARPYLAGPGSGGTPDLAGPSLRTAAPTTSPGIRSDPSSGRAPPSSLPSTLPKGAEGAHGEADRSRPPPERPQAEHPGVGETISPAARPTADERIASRLLALEHLAEEWETFRRELRAEAALWLSPEAMEARIAEALARRPADRVADDALPSLRPAVREMVREELSHLLPGTLTPPQNPPADLEGEFRSALEEERVRYRQLLAESLRELQERTETTLQFQNSLRGDLEALDGKFRALTTKMLPLLRKTWVRLAEMERANRRREGTGEVSQLREELWQELHRVETDLNVRTREVLDRLEANLQSQGRLWLNLTTQLSGLSEERKELRQDLGRHRDGTPGALRQPRADENPP
jgi:hypothetical protein